MFEFVYAFHPYIIAPFQCALIFVSAIRLIPSLDKPSPPTSEHDICQLQSPPEYLLVQLVLLLLFGIGIVRKNAHYAFPLLSLNFTIYIFFLAYDLIETVPKYLTVSKGTVEEFIMNKFNLMYIGISHVALIHCGAVVFNFYFLMLRKEFGIESTTVENNPPKCEAIEHEEETARVSV